MGDTRLGRAIVYLAPAELEQIAADAEDHGVTLSAYIRARLGFQITRPGAPAGNQNARKKPADKRSARKAAR